jgi:hypothetical protein
MDEAKVNAPQGVVLAKEHQVLVGAPDSFLEVAASLLGKPLVTIQTGPVGTVVRRVLVEEGMPPVPGAAIIAEYLDETRGAKLAQPRLLPRDAGPRVEVRRLMSWFNDKFFVEVSGPLTT